MNSEHRHTVRIVNRLGLHARAASKFVQTAQRFAAEVTVNVETKTANGKSIMSVMMLEGSCGKDIEIITLGEDAHSALNALVGLISDRFGEAE